MSTYELGTSEKGHAYIKCLRCNRESYNPNDISQRYCPNPECGYHEHDLLYEGSTREPDNADPDTWKRITLSTAPPQVMQDTFFLECPMCAASVHEDSASRHIFWHRNL